MNNGLKSKDSIMLIESLQKHSPRLIELNLSKNKMGIKGACYLAEALKSMKLLTQLDLAENEIGDFGITEIAKVLNNYGVLEYLDISGNNIGKTNQILECAEALGTYLATNPHLEHFKISWNNLRGVAGEKIIEGLIHSSGIKTVCMNNNLLGIAYDGKQSPVCKISELFLH